MSQVTPEPMPETEKWMDYEIDRLMFKFRDFGLIVESRKDYRPNVYEIEARLKIGGRELYITQTMSTNLDKLSFFHFFLLLDRRIEMAIEDSTIPKIPPLVRFKAERVE